MSTTTPPSSTSDTSAPPWPLYFTKMHGLGNDFMVLDCTRHAIELQPEHIRTLADRHFGVGFDQLLMVEPSPGTGIDFGYRIFNADGSEVEQCGNGARCFARFVVDQGLTQKRLIRVKTRAGVIVLNVTERGDVQVDMGVPRLLPGEIPFVAAEAALSYTVAVQEGSDETVELSVVNMGNPHCVVFVDRVDSVEVEKIGPLFEKDPLFPERVNTEFVRVASRNTLKMRVWERGNGETQACGTGACAAVVAAVERGLCDKGVDVTVKVRGGELVVCYTDEQIYLTGGTETVYSGTIEF